MSTAPIPVDVDASMKSMLGHLAFEVAVLRAQLVQVKAENAALKGAQEVPGGESG